MKLSVIFVWLSIGESSTDHSTLWPFVMIIGGVVGLALPTAFTTGARPQVPPTVELTPKRPADC